MGELQTFLGEKVTRISPKNTRSFSCVHFALRLQFEQRGELRGYVVCDDSSHALIILRGREVMFRQGIISSESGQKSGDFCKCGKKTGESERKTTGGANEDLGVIKRELDGNPNSAPGPRPLTLAHARAALASPPPVSKWK